MRKLIGKGAFTRAYQIGENEVEVVSRCPAKEAYALFSQGNPLAPVIEKHDCLDDGSQVYRMPLYPKVRAPKQQLNAQAYAAYKVLRDIMDKYHAKAHSGHKTGYDELWRMIDASQLDDYHKEYVEDLLSDVCNAIDCDDLGYEISPRNISVTPSGGLVMLDCFFSRKALFNKW